MQPLIAVVDDRLEVGNMIAVVAELHGFRCDWYSGGEEFLHRYRPEPGCVILDLLMPEMDGFDVLRRMALCGWTVPVIAVGLDPASKDDALRLGAVAFLLLPHSWGELLDCIRSALQAGVCDEPVIRFGSE